MPRLAASSNARMTLRSVKRYISSQTDFLAALMASVTGCSPASGSTKTWTPWTPGPVVQLPWHDELLDCGRLMEHPASRIESVAMMRYLQEGKRLLCWKDVGRIVAIPR